MGSLGIVLTHGPYALIVILMVLGLYIVFSTGNLIRKMVGVGIFQSAAGLFFIALAKVNGGTAAIYVENADVKAALAASLDPAYTQRYGVDGVIYSNPLPHVLILTAIVVSVATLAVGLALAVRVRESYGSVESAEIAACDQLEDAGEPGVRAEGGTAR